MQNLFMQPMLALIGTTTYWVIMIGLAFLSYALRPKPSQTRPDPGQFEVPSISPGKSIPVVFGTVMIRDPAIVWWGDLRTEPIMSSGGGKK